MGIRWKHTTLLSSLLLVVACAAFDNEDKFLEDVNADGNPIISVGGPSTQWQGFYVGGASLDGENRCKSGGVIPKEVAIDVMHTGTVVSVQFEDGTGTSGTLTGNNVSLLVTANGQSLLYELAFNEDGARGKIHVIESTTQGQLDQACAMYKLTLARGEKPAGFGAGDKQEEKK